MKIRFYISTTDATEFVQQVVGHFDASEKKEFAYLAYDGENVGGLRFQKDQNGVYVEGKDFLNGVPQGITDKELPIRIVSLYDEGTSGRPQLGMYELDGAQALVDSFDKPRRAGSGGFSGAETIWVDEKAWRIRVTAETLEPAVALYRQFRKGTLEPTEAWNDLAPSLRFLTDQNTILRKELEVAQAANLSSDAEKESVGSPA